MAGDVVTTAAVWVFTLSIEGPHGGRVALAPESVLVAVAVSSTVGALAVQDAYRSVTHVVDPVNVTRTWRAIPVPVLAVLVVAGLLGAPVSPSRAVFGGVCASVALLTVRWGVAIWVRRCRLQGRFVTRTLLVGTGEAAFDLWRHVTSRPDSGRVIVGYAGDLGYHDWDLRRLAAVDDAVTVATRLGLDGVMVAEGAADPAVLDEVVRRAHAAGLDVELTGCPPHVHHRRLVATEVAHEPVFFVEPRHARRARTVAKRVFDVVGACVILVVAAPVFLVVAVAILVDGGRPVFYRQVRVGRDGRLFRLWKFRTMVRGADLHDDELRSAVSTHHDERRGGPLFKLSADPRVTRVGGLLRALSIDELPQLFNVVAGSMSLVGPRPALPGEVAEFDAELRNRCRVSPGMTGLWQIEARDNPDFHAYRQLDLFYVENWSLGLDLAILAATVPCLVRHAFVERRRRRAALVDERPVDDRLVGAGILDAAFDPDGGDDASAPHGTRSRLTQVSGSSLVGLESR